jgi:flagellar P-ring protein precursor FlgI
MSYLKVITLKFIALGLLSSLFFAQSASAARLKDIADIEGVRGNQLYGYGLVVGLEGTGDGNSVAFTPRSLSNMLERLGVSVSERDVRVKNVAAVMVTATLPAFIRPGSKIDITISSVGDAKSLQGGTLLLTPLRGADGNVYAVGQGPVTVGGFAFEGGEGDRAQKNHPTVGTISGGALVERAIPFDLFQAQRVRVVLRQPDFTTVTRVVEEINREFGRPLAVGVDGASIEVPIVGEFARDPIGLLARLEHVVVDQDTGARVVVNERTGTIIMGENVRVGKVALAHGNLNISIRSEVDVSQPAAFAEVGETQVITNTDVQVSEDVSGFSVVGGHVTLGELVNALNALGATPRDLIAIFTALKRAGALHADLDIM